MHDFVRRFLGADDHALSPDDALSALVRMTESASVSNIQVLFSAQIFFRYLLLDMCANAYNFPPTNSIPIIRDPCKSLWVDTINKVSRSGFLPFYDPLTVIAQTVALLQDWPQLISRFRGMYSAAKGGSISETLLRIPDGNTAQWMFIVGLRSLTRARTHQASKLFDKVMFNIEVLAFSIWWIHVVRHVSGSCWKLC